MHSYLEAIPCDILQYIALLTSVDLYPPSASPRNILALLLTSSTLYYSLCLQNCPHLYADVFRTVFDVRANLRRFRFRITDSILAGELVLRCQMLRRVRSKSISAVELHQDLWTAFLMILESDGLNELHLRSAGLSELLLDIVKSWEKAGVSAPHQIQALVIWLLQFTLTEQLVFSLRSDTKEYLRSFLTPHSLNLGSMPVNDRSVIQLTRFPSYVRADDTISPEARSQNSTHREYTGGHQRESQMKPVMSYGREWVPSCPDLTPAAASLIFCLTEHAPIAIPDHLPENRSIAIATQRLGPTKEDIRKIRGYKTRLFADTAPRVDCRVDSLTEDVHRSLWNDVESQQVTQADERVMEVNAPLTMYGLMTGIWEGFYMMAGMVTPNLGNVRRRHPVSEFLSRKPLQCALAEFICSDDKDDNGSCTTSIDIRMGNLPKLSLETATGFKLGRYNYKRLTVEPGSHREAQPRTGTARPAEIILLGETLEEHEQAWGAFTFAGCVRRDGSILLKREPKETGADGHAGAWIFEGRICFSSVFVGTWYLSSSSVNPAIRGIFSMQKRASGLASW